MNNFTVNINALDKRGQKELRKIVYMFEGKGTVKKVRSMLVMGRGMAIFMTLMTCLFVIGLGFIFLPILLIAPLTLLVVPLKIKNDNAKWHTVLPADRDDDVVVLN